MIFFPRKSYIEPDNRDIMISITDKIKIGSRVHLSDKLNHNIIFFHGNGEICQDYDTVASMFNTRNINFIVIDYRGYGLSNGKPTKENLLTDSTFIFDWIEKYLTNHGYTGKITIMGRSLGSASVCNILESRSDKIHSTIIESGFSTEEFFCEILNIEVKQYNQDYGFRNLRKISKYKKPLYIIHADQDHIVPLENGLNLYDKCPSKIKYLYIVKGANHNNILSVESERYFDNIKRFIDNVN